MRNFRMVWAGGVGDVDWEISKPQYGMSTSCNDWYGTVRGFLAEECGWGVTPLDKYVFPRSPQWFGYGYEKQFRYPNQTNMDNGILKANVNFEAGEKRKVLGIIAIRVDDLLISGSDGFVE